MGIYVPWLADAARMTGYPVIELPGHRTRGHGGFRVLEGVVGHHTATSDKAGGDYPSERIVRDGRSDLAGPLANYGLGRSGAVYVVASGVAWHAGASRWAGFSDLNDEFLGIEAESAGYGGWSPAQLDAYPRLVAAALFMMRRGADRYAGHKDVCLPAGRKPDPRGIDTRWLQDVVRSYAGDPARIARGGGGEELDMSIATEIRDIVRRYVPSGLAFGYTLPASPDRVRTFTGLIPPRNGVVTGDQGTVYVALAAGENTEITAVYAEEDWTADGKRGKRYDLQGRYMLVAGDRQSWKVPGAATQISVAYQGEAPLSMSVEIDTQWK